MDKALKNISSFKVNRYQLVVPENCEYEKMPLLNDDIYKGKIHIIITEITSKFSDFRALVAKPADEMQFTPT